MSWEELRELVVKMLYRLGMREPDQIDDAAQDVLLSLWRAEQEGKVIGKTLAHYAFGVARNTVANRHRRARPVAPLEHAGSVALDEPTPEQALLRAEAFDRGFAVFATLPPQDQEILTRFYLQGQNQHQIAAAMSITPDQFRVRKHRAKKRLEDGVAQAA